MNKVHFSSNTNEWATPAKLFEDLDREFHFNLDPCSTDENAKCQLHYTIDTDGLTKDWGGEMCSVIPPTVENCRNGSGSVKIGRAHV